jgi:hypothetical protein
MKPIPDHIVDSGPPGTVWFGGSVDRSTMTLRIECDMAEVQQIAELLGCSSEPSKHGWRLSALASEPADINAQVQQILSRATSDLSVWRELSSRHRIDLFCGLFLERSNRGISLSPETMSEVSARGISFGFDIYAPE